MARSHAFAVWGGRRWKREMLRRLKSRAAMKAQGGSTRAPSLGSVALARDDKAMVRQR